MTWCSWFVKRLYPYCIQQGCRKQYQSAAASILSYQSHPNIYQPYHILLLFIIAVDECFTTGVFQTHTNKNVVADGEFMSNDLPKPEEEVV